jgi:hypothetical protein
VSAVRGHVVVVVVIVVAAVDEVVARMNRRIATWLKKTLFKSGLTYFASASALKKKIEVY